MSKNFHIAIISNRVNDVTAAVTALVLSHSYSGLNVKVSLLQGTGENTAEQIVLNPDSQQFMHDFGLEYRELCVLANARFSLGVNYENWRAENDDVFVAYGRYGFAAGGSYGVSMEGVPFANLMHSLNKPETAKEYSHYSLVAEAAKNNKFTLANNQLPPVLAQLRHALIVDQNAFCDLLLEKAKLFGLNLIDSYDHLKITEQGENSHHKYLLEFSNNAINADFIFDVRDVIDEIDNSNARSNFVWTSNLELNTTETLPIYQRVIAYQDGWFKMIYGHTSLTVEFHTDKNYEQSEIESMFNERLSELTIIKDKHSYSRIELTSHQKPNVKRADVWKNNKLDLAEFLSKTNSVFLSRMDFVQKLLKRFVSLFHVNESYFFQEAEFNRLANNDLNRLEEINSTLFAACHFRTEFWSHLNTRHKLTGQARLELYRQTGRLAYYEGELISQEIWHAILTQFGYAPLQYQSSIRIPENQQIQEKLEEFKSLIKEVVNSLPSADECMNAFKQQGRII